MQWPYILMGAVLLGGWAALYALRLRHTRKMLAYEEQKRAGEPPEPDAGPQLAPEITRDMIQEDETAGDSD